ncbi:hypothetical protein F66182_18560, partial [Fusarium sp. NRRL 66182]
ALKEKHADKLSNLDAIASIRIGMTEAAFNHGGFNVKKPVATTGAQMSAAYTAAVQLVDGQVLPNQFKANQLERDIVWDLIGKTECFHDLDLGEDRYTQRVTITLKDGTEMSETLDNPRSVSPGLSNEEILEKWRRLTQDIIDEKTRDRIQQLVLDIEALEDVNIVDDLMSTSVSNLLLS